MVASPTEANIYRVPINNDVEPPPSHPKPSEWKTPPLWGVADSAPYFHDGASPTLHDAIMRHDATARRSKESYKKLLRPKRDALIAFLHTLRAPAVR